MLGCAFSHQGKVCRGDYLETYPDTYSQTYLYVDQKKGQFLFYWAIVSIAAILLYVMIVCLVFMLVAFEKH